MSIRILTLLSLLTLSPLPFAQAQLLVNETFSDGDRTTNSPPTSLAWVVGAHRDPGTSAHGTLTVASGAMTLDHTQSDGVSSFAAVLGYFTPGGSPVSLNVGESLSLTFDVSFQGGAFPNSGGAFRWALMNSNNSRLTADQAGNSAPGISSGSIFNNWRGYEGQSPINPSLTGSTNLLTRERTGTGSGLFDSGQFSTFGSSAVQEPLIEEGLTYEGSLTLTRTGSGVEVVAGLGDVFSVMVLDSTTPVTSFDTIAFFTVPDLTHDITFSNIQLNLAAVPEPSTWIMGLAGFGLLGRIVLRGLRRRQLLQALAA